MKKTLNLITIILILFTITSCQFHFHTYEDNYSYDDEYHYIETNCEHKIIKNKEKHLFDEEIIIEPTKTSSGLTKYICQKCSYYKELETSFFYQKCNGKGTIDSPYEIKNVGNLYWFADYVNNIDQTITGILLSDIVVNEKLLNIDGSLLNKSPYIWNPIGNKKPYKGIFEGNNHTISGLYFNNQDLAYAGLFGKNNGIIKNLKLNDSYFLAHDFVGGIVGDNTGIIENCYNNSTIIGKFEAVGGICGGNFGTIKNTINEGKIMGDSFNNEKEILETTNGYQIIKQTSLTINCQAIGGISGGNYGIIETSINKGTIIAGSNVGGITGWNNYQIINSSNEGLIISISDTSFAYAGGIAGYNSALGSVEQSINKGNIITNRHYLGGIIGFSEANGVTKITNSFNEGSVSGKMYVGGISGYNQIEILNCYNLGNIYGTRNVGGITGYNKGNKKQSTKIINCYNAGMIKCTNNQPIDLLSIAGYNNLGIIINCYYLEGTCQYQIKDETIKKTLKEFKSGEVTYLLNQSNPTNPWRQNLKTDQFPNFNSLKIYFDELNNKYYN